MHLDVHHCDLNINCFIYTVPDTAISIFTSSQSAPSLGQTFIIHCVVSETVSGLSTRPVPQWLNNDGSNIVDGSGIILDGPNFQSTLTTLTMMFNALHTSHAGRYICQGSLTSPVLSSTLVKTEDYNITIQSELISGFRMLRAVMYILVK